MVFAGEEAGAKIFVELKGGPGVAAPATAMKKSNKPKTRIFIGVATLCRCLIFIQKLQGSAGLLHVAKVMAMMRGPANLEGESIVEPCPVSYELYPSVFVGRKVSGNQHEPGVGQVQLTFDMTEDLIIDPAVIA